VKIPNRIVVSLEASRFTREAAGPTPPGRFPRNS
jgi:hypothetical protein